MDAEGAGHALAQAGYYRLPNSSVMPRRGNSAGKREMVMPRMGILAMFNVATTVLGLVTLLVLGGALTLTVSTICGGRSPQ